MRAEEIKGLMEAYSHVYETPEVLNEEVVEEETEQLDEIAINPAAAGASRNRSQAAAVRQKLQGGGSINVSGPQGFFGGRDKAGTASLNKDATKSQGRTVLNFNQAQTRGGFRGSQTGAYTPNTTVVGGEKLYKAKLGGKDVYVGAKKPGAAAPSAAKPSTPTPPAKPAAAPAAAKPAAAPAAAKPAAAPAAAKPTTPAAPAKPAGSAMDQWAAANPKLAAAKAERDRTRGTSATTNPLMKDMKANLPAPKSPSPSTAKTGFDLAKKGVNLAAGVDLFDLVKGHLLDEGYADSEEGAMVIMVNMSEEWRKSILEAHGIELDESSYSAKAARAGKDIGKPGKMFGKIAKEAGERYGSEERGKKVAGAVLAKLRKEDLDQLTEISKELALKAHAERATNEFETDGDDPRDFTKSGKSKADESERRIVKKHGEGARREANRAAEKRIYGHNKYSEAQEREQAKKKMKEEYVDEAQRARENPEDHDKEEKRKYEPVRGERTPMPPRGDKRREEFEKWYAKQMGR